MIMEKKDEFVEMRVRTIDEAMNVDKLIGHLTFDQVMDDEEKMDIMMLDGQNFKLLLEAVERYIVVGVLCYTSPLAFCMGGSKATSQVFKSWCRMVGSRLLLLVMNVWFIR